MSFYALKMFLSSSPAALIRRGSAPLAINSLSCSFPFHRSSPLPFGKRGYSEGRINKVKPRDGKSELQRGCNNASLMQ